MLSGQAENVVAERVNIHRLALALRLLFVHFANQFHRFTELQYAKSDVAKNDQSSRDLTQPVVLPGTSRISEQMMKCVFFLA